MRHFALAISLLIVSACGSSSADPAAPATPTAQATPAPAPAAANGPIPEPLPGVDTAALSAAEKRTFFQILDARTSPCGQAMSVTRCVREGAQCPACRHSARYLARLLGEGYPAELARDLLAKRYDDAAKVELSTEGCAFRGNATAAVTIIEFADFECPHCREAHHAFDTIFDELPVASAARLCYRFFPLGGHENARPAARAAVAAMNQGKFWQMHDALYENQTALNPAFYTTTAQTLGLDMTRFAADLELPETDARVQRDRDEGERIRINGTPAIYVNGRPYEGSNDPASLRAYVMEELDR